MTLQPPADVLEPDMIIIAAARLRQRRSGVANDDAKARRAPGRVGTVGETGDGFGEGACGAFGVGKVG